MTSQELIQLEDLYGAHNYHPLDVVISKGQGIWVHDLEGKKYLTYYEIWLREKIEKIKEVMYLFTNQFF